MVECPTTLTFSGHETFPFRYSWLKKGVDAVRESPGLFREDRAMTVLGVGKNMVRSIRHWCLAVGVLEEIAGDSRKPSGCFRPSALGEALFGDAGLDPYLEDSATPWLLHWQIASNVRRCTTWFWAFSYFHEPEFTREGLFSALFAWSRAAGAKRVAESSLRRDVDCFLRTYVPARQSKVLTLEDTLDCPLVELGLIRASADRQTYQFHRGAQPYLPDGVLFFAVLDFWDRYAAGTTTLSVRDLARQPGSPGQLFELDENALADRFADMESWTDGAVSYDETAGLRQLYRRKFSPAFARLDRIYEEAGRTERRERCRV